MKEIELKVLEVDKKALIARLKRLGARNTFSGRLHAQMFDYPDRRLRKNGILIRLRKAGRDSCMTIKKKLPIKGVKAAEENEFYVSDFASAKILLESIGLTVTGQITKQRESYCLGKVTYEFDTIEGIPTYLEVEANDEKYLPDAIKKIGLRAKDAKPWSTRQVLEFYKNRRIIPSASRR